MTTYRTDTPPIPLVQAVEVADGEGVFMGASTEVTAWCCGQCGRGAWPEKHQAEYCCGTPICDCGKETTKPYLKCEDCRRESARETEQRHIDKAKRLEGWTGPVFYESNEHYYDCVSDAIDDITDNYEGEDPFTAYLWPCREVHPRLDAMGILNDALEVNEAHEDADWSTEAVKAFQEFVDDWNETYSDDITSWWPRYDEVIELTITPAPEPSNDDR